jgi:hypothetical protein
MEAGVFRHAPTLLSRIAATPFAHIVVVGVAAWFSAKKLCRSVLRRNAMELAFHSHTCFPCALRPAPVSLARTECAWATLASAHPSPRVLSGNSFVSTEVAATVKIRGTTARTAPCASMGSVAPAVTGCASSRAHHSKFSVLQVNVRTNCLHRGAVASSSAITEKRAHYLLARHHSSLTQASSQTCPPMMSTRSIS